MPEIPRDGPVTVLAADPCPMSLLGLRSTIEDSPRLHLTTASVDGFGALAAIRADRPRVAILDAHLDDHDGCELTRIIRYEQLPTRTIVIAEQHTGDLVLQAFTAGAAGFLSKRTQLPAIIDAILQVADGRSVLASDIGSTLADLLQNRADDDDHLRLTERELEVLHHIARGETAAAIAQHLNLATPTIKTHIQNVYLKLGVNDRAAAVAVAIRRGLLG